MPSSKLHNEELAIDVDLAYKLISEQFLNWKSLSITPINHSGTDNIIFRLGRNKIIRLPRIYSAATQAEKEQKWLSKLAPQLPLEVPLPLAKGLPSKDYPYNWSVYNYIKGKNLYEEKPESLIQTAKILAQFIKSLQNIDIKGAPQAKRGLPLETQTQGVYHAISSLKDTIDVDRVTSIWKKCLNANKWNNLPVWLHGDLLPLNLLIHSTKLVAIIDFGLSGIGDPACDLLPAWSIFDPVSRNFFRETLKVDNDTWMRGKGWALSIALIIIPYYQNSNIELTSIAKQIIKNILAE